MKTIVYIDGGNLYYGLLKGFPQYKWLDLRLLSRKLIRPDHEIIGIKYFTSRTKTYPHDQAASERQNIYIQALMAVGGIEIIEGYYNKNKAWIPAANDKCRQCEVSDAKGYVSVIKLEEKRTDVNIATEMLRDAFCDNADSLVLISGDSDFIAPLDLIRQELKKQVIVFNPHDRSTDLRFHSSYCKDVDRNVLGACLLPDEVVVGNRRIRRPEAWR